VIPMIGIRNGIQKKGHLGPGQKPFALMIPHNDLPPWLSGLAISGRGAAKAWLAMWQGVGSYPTPAGMSSQVSA